jgi:hypothetical protein
MDLCGIVMGSILGTGVLIMMGACCMCSREDATRRNIITPSPEFIMQKTRYDELINTPPVYQETPAPVYQPTNLTEPVEEPLPMFDDIVLPPLYVPQVNEEEQAYDEPQAYVETN